MISFKLMLLKDIPESKSVLCCNWLVKYFSYMYLFKDGGGAV